MTRGHRRATVVTLALATLFASRAFAQPSAADRALATELFNEGRDAMSRGDYPVACPKLEESQRLDPGGGTLLNVARCHQLAGRTATAWTEFHEALAIAEREGQKERVDFATEQIAALEPALSRLVIVVPPATDRPDLVVERDGTPVARAAWGAAMPVDPGAHTVAAHAAGYLSWTTEITLGASADRKEVSVPPLVVLPQPKILPPPLPPPRLPAPVVLALPRAPTVAGWALVGFATASLGVGTAAGIATFVNDGASDDRCEPRCDLEGYDLNQSAKVSADVSTAFFVIGAVSLGVGLTVLLTRKPVQKNAASFVLDALSAGAHF